MTLLRHISGPDLKKLQRDLELLTSPIIVLNVSNVRDQWFIHFLVQDISEREQGISVEVSKKTKTLKPKVDASL